MKCPDCQAEGRAQVIEFEPAEVYQMKIPTWGGSQYRKNSIPGHVELLLEACGHTHFEPTDESTPRMKPGMYID